MAKVPWIGTSWKMNKIRADARAFARVLAADPLSTTDAACLFVIPPFTAIADTAEILDGSSIVVGAQNMHWSDRGAWTGEISPLMIMDCGATLVELGHSERRIAFGETDETVAKKTMAAVHHGLIALVCVGESRDAYEAGRTASVLRTQVKAALSLLGPKALGQVVIAYEPVWSIGEGGIPADPDFADRQHAFIKEVTASLLGDPLDVIYGGSVNAANCCDLIARPNIDGLFVGRAAWTAEGYLGIVDAVISSLRR